MTDVRRSLRPQRGRRPGETATHGAGQPAYKQKVRSERRECAAASGQPRSVPLVVITDGDRLILFASNFGQAHYPGWYYNLRAHPQATLTVDGQTREYTAREAVGAERDRLWQEAVNLYAGYAAYQRRIGDKRHVPVMVLTPAAAESETEV